MMSSPLADVTSTSASADIDKDLAALAESMRELNYRKDCIDIELAILAESARVLRSRKNALVPRISRLPTEVLESVFEYLEEVKRFDGSAHDDVPACLVVTHVCRHWRTVALECPTLWTFIYTPSPRYVGIMLERSKDFPLVVTYNTEVSLQDCLVPILSQLPRIKILRFTSPFWEVKHITDLLLSQPAPLLEVFEFYSLKPPGAPLFTHRLTSSDIFKERAPRLRSVELGMFSLSLAAHVFSGLRTLCVTRTTTYQTTVPELLSALSRMPALEHLTVEKLDIVSSTTKLDEVSLARLKSIALGAISIRDATSLFEHLSIPANAKIALKLTKIGGPQDFSGLFSAMNRYPNGTGSVFRSMRAIDYCIPSFVVQFSTSTEMQQPDIWNTPDDDIRLSIQFTFEVWEQAEPSIIYDICRLVTGTQNKIQTFAYGSDHRPTRDFWRAGSAFLPEVEMIYNNCSHIGGLIDALKINEGEQDPDISYPSLRALFIESVTFEDGDAEKLKDAMKTRAQHGVCIQSLRLVENDFLSADQIQGFREVVTDVVEQDGPLTRFENWWANSFQCSDSDSWPGIME
ncbi:hypothetical protein DEU56DRAFT_980490 [Suillus clintonianus]|uniref:uncharacterized protein n=1 Tax=Suillus clintonianus TaxID=1904413 RepID=UPI001B878F0D|nr:uncharacterized protein DEU56DRAFT_980490 [Suillus clintonianus]KAG2138501.1 hypothetical protein DEU56DRAFT_980490 [Suillus clintonianus]